MTFSVYSVATVAILLVLSGFIGCYRLVDVVKTFGVAPAPTAVSVSAAAAHHKWVFRGGGGRAAGTGGVDGPVDLMRALYSIPGAELWVDVVYASRKKDRSSLHVCAVSYTHLTLPTIYSV